MSTENLGLPLIPIKSGTKLPVGSWKHAGRTTPMTDAEFAGCGYGLECGVIAGWHSGFQAIDFDADGEETFQAFWRQVPDTIKHQVYVEKSPHGRHIICRIAKPESHKRLARRWAIPGKLDKHGKEETGVQLLIETRGQDQYIIVAPTPGYTYCGGPAIQQLPVLWKHAWEILCDIAKSFDQIHPVAVEKPTQTEEPVQEVDFTCWDLWRWMSRHATKEDWEWLLEECSWEYAYSDKEGRHHYRRPCKWDDGVSGNLYRHEGKVWLFYCHTTSAALEAGKAYNWAGFWDREGAREAERAIPRILTSWYARVSAKNREMDMCDFFNNFHQEAVEYAG